jgi:2,4-dienoyl-CoA reductase-like NADH-dependent reductase (Old Yellow Enzyme family)
MPIDLSPLFTPFRIAGLRLPIRFVMAPMTRMFSPGGVPGPDVAAYYARRAAGGVGLILTEGIYIDHPAAGGHPDVPQLHGEPALAGWTEVVRRVHAEGGRIAAQLWHVGPQRTVAACVNPQAESVSPSGVRLGRQDPARTMTPADIDDVVASYARAAANAAGAGFDGIELHGAHGYLIDQFLWSGTNLRTDGYGGAPAARARFAAEIVAACRAATAPDLPILFRTSHWKSGDYEARLAQTPQELEALLAPLVDAGVDAFHASARRHFDPAFTGSPLGLAGWVKRVTGLPTVTVGAVGLDGDLWTAYVEGGRARTVPLDRLLEQFTDGEFDLVAVGRALLTDPEWVRKVREGRYDELRSFAAADRLVLT